MTPQIFRVLHDTFMQLPEDKFTALETAAKIKASEFAITREHRSLWLISNAALDNAVLARLSIAFNEQGCLIKCE